MAFAAIHPQAGRIDATRQDLGAGLAWEQVHKTKPRVALTCPDCAHSVHAKVSARRLRYFAHNPGRPRECAWDNESLEHHLIKLELAVAIRAQGWHAELEVRAPDGSWRADVLASTQDGTRRIAWEVQLSPIDTEDITARTSRYALDGIEVCWVGAADRLSWMGLVPSFQVQAPDGNGAWTVVDGVAGFDYREGSWRMTRSSLSDVLGWVLREQILFHEILPRYRRSLLGAGAASRKAVWTSPRSIDAEGRHEQMRQRQEAWKREQAELARQAKLLQAHEDALAEDIRRTEADRVLKHQQAQDEARWARLRRQRELDEQAREKQREAEQEAIRQQERIERETATLWWQDLSMAQREELFSAVRDRLQDIELSPMWRNAGGRPELDKKATLEHAYGVAVYLKAPVYGEHKELCAVIRPSPSSAHRLPDRVQVLVRNTREARLLTDTGAVATERVVVLDLPEGEQLSLL
ncbi:competence protein CoiA family protein [Lentzea sp. NPDC102401]|uniref:competence protein CoiA n=1 Tax=Lentzea sp. NPDC102401 TaxID=3364128 RepID=UPI003814FFC9